MHNIAASLPQSNELQLISPKEQQTYQPMQKQTVESFLLKYQLSKLENLRHRILRRQHYVLCSLPLFCILAFCTMAFAWAVLLPFFLRIDAGHVGIRISSEWKTQGVIASALQRGDVVISPALQPGAGLCDQMFNWASVRTLAGRLAAHLPANRSLVVVVPSNSKLFRVFGLQVCCYSYLKNICCVFYRTPDF